MTIGTTSSGTFYNYNKKKQTTPIVFIHGVGLTYEIWRPQLEFFRDYIFDLAMLIIWVIVVTFLLISKSKRIPIV